MRQRHSQRNAAILQLHESGRPLADIAAEFNITPGHVREIIKRVHELEAYRTALEKKYGQHPKIDALPDETSIEVLALCNTKVFGWAVRLRSLEHASKRPIRTLGDLRRATDAQLLGDLELGKQMVGELRRLCPLRAK